MLKLGVDQIRANCWNCNFLDDVKQQTLKQCMREDGPEKTLPIVVRKMADGCYEIVDGEHRWLLAKELGWETISVLEREVDDLQSKALGVIYNRVRGRLNWFKLYDVVRKDLDAGVDLAVAYGEALTGTELEWLLSLGNLVPKARLVLEASLKKYPEYSLEQLYMLSLFPVVQQESLVERFKTPLVLHVLRQTLAPFLAEKEQTTRPTKETQPQTYQEQTFASLDKTTISNKYPNTNTYIDQETRTDTQPTLPPNLWQNNNSANPSHIPPTSTAADQTTDPHATDRVQDSKEKVKAQIALLLSVSYDCDCGRHYSANFKNASIVVQKQNLLFEYVDFKPRTFQVYCDKCNSEHEFTVEGIEAEAVQIFCRRCKPSREGFLSINTGEVTWYDN